MLVILCATALGFLVAHYFLTDSLIDLNLAGRSRMVVGCHE